MQTFLAGVARDTHVLDQLIKCSDEGLRHRREDVRRERVGIQFRSHLGCAECSANQGWVVLITFEDLNEGRWRAARQFVRSSHVLCLT